MNKHVYVLGAGASMPFGLPRGGMLKKDILDLTLLTKSAADNHTGIHSKHTVEALDEF